MFKVFLLFIYLSQDFSQPEGSNADPPPCLKKKKIKHKDTQKPTPNDIVEKFPEVNSLNLSFKIFPIWALNFVLFTFFQYKTTESFFCKISNSNSFFYFFFFELWWQFGSWPFIFGFGFVDTWRWSCICL